MAAWHGTQQEYEWLTAAINRNCPDECKKMEITCFMHAMLKDNSNQKLLDRLLFVFRMRERFLIEEWKG